MYMFVPVKSLDWGFSWEEVKNTSYLFIHAWHNAAIFLLPITFCEDFTPCILWLSDIENREN